MGFQALLPCTLYQSKFVPVLDQNAMTVSYKSQRPKLLDEGYQVLRLHHYPIYTERSCIDWIVEFAHFHHMRSR